MNSLTRDGTAEPISRDQILRRERGQGNIHFPCSADHEKDWQRYPVDPYSCCMCHYTNSQPRKFPTPSASLGVYGITVAVKISVNNSLRPNKLQRHVRSCSKRLYQNQIKHETLITVFHCCRSTSYGHASFFVFFRLLHKTKSF